MTENTQGIEWLKPLVKIPDGVPPDENVCDFDAEHPIPKYLENYFYFYAQGSSKNEVSRYFILPDDFPLYQFRQSKRSTKRRLYFAFDSKITVSDLRKRQTLTAEEKKTSFTSNRLHLVMFIKKWSREHRIQGRNSIYLGPGPCPESDEFDEFMVTHAVCGYKPDDTQLRKNGRIYSSGDMSTKPDSYWSSNK